VVLGQTDMAAWTCEPLPCNLGRRGPKPVSVDECGARGGYLGPLSDDIANCAGIDDSSCVGKKFLETCLPQCVTGYFMTGSKTLVCLALKLAFKNLQEFLKEFYWNFRGWGVRIYKRVRLHAFIFY
jgi:hypothetical protein